MDDTGLAMLESLREWRARLDLAESELAEREQAARNQGDRAELDAVASARDALGADWDSLAESHDAWARRRDLQGLARDKRSSNRDVSARRLADDNDAGFADRWHSAGDRDDSSGDRADSFDDRHDGGDARERAAADRDRSATDRALAAVSAADRVEEVRQLQQAASSRTVIGQALGLLMARQGLSSDEAFTALVRLSQTSNTRLRDVAADMVAEAQPDRT